MAGGLHGLDMIKQLRNNSNLRKLNYFKKVGSKSSEGKHIEMEPVSEQVSKAILEGISSSNRGEKNRKIRIFILASFITVCLFLLLFYFLRF